jgi:regulator of ribonuclease activity A
MSNNPSWKIGSGFSTADLFDRYIDDHEKAICVAAPGFVSFGGSKIYYGPISTVRCASGSALRLKDILSEPGNGRVLVADAGAIDTWALVGDKLASLGLANGWTGVVVHGYVRDIAALRSIPFGVHALGAVPAKPRVFAQKGVERDVRLEFRRLSLEPGHWLYADEDGIVVSNERLLLDDAA